MEEDFKNLKFRRLPGRQRIEDEPLEEDTEGDGLHRDMELDMMDDMDSEPGGYLEDDYRIPPQWTPDRQLANLVWDATETFGIDGKDTAKLRDILMGKFWKRPLESFVSRLADDWERSQPLHLRHLSIVKDTTVTADKKFSHYIYRTHGNFQAATDLGDVSWDVVSKEARAKSSNPNKKHGGLMTLDSWGFSPLNVKDFHRQSGASTLTDSRQAITHDRRRTTWDNGLWQQMGKRRPGLSSSPATTPRRTVMPEGPMECSPVPSQKKSRSSAVPTRLLSKNYTGSSEISLDNGLGEDIEDEITQQHRHMTDDLISVSGDTTKSKDTSKSKKFILTAEQRRDLGLSTRGRLPKDIQERMRKKEGGFSVPPIKPGPSQGPLLTREQRKEKGLPSHGRLPERVLAELQRLRSLGLDPSTIVLPLPDDGPIHVNVASSAQDSFEKMPVNDKPLSADESPYAPPAPSTAIPTGTSVTVASSTTSPNVPKIRSAGLRSLPTNHNLSDSEHISAPTSATVASVAEQTVAPVPRRKRKVSTNPVHQFLNEQEPKNHQIGRNYEDTVAPGFYYDSDATYVGGRGRPRHAFLCIVKTKLLHGFTWFKPDCNASAIIKYSQFGLTSPAQARQAKQVSNLDANPTEASGSTAHEKQYMQSNLSSDSSIITTETSRQRRAPKRSPVPQGVPSKVQEDSAMSLEAPLDMPAQEPSEIPSPTSSRATSGITEGELPRLEAQTPLAMSLAETLEQSRPELQETPKFQVLNTPGQGTLEATVAEDVDMLTQESQSNTSAVQSPQPLLEQTLQEDSREPSLNCQQRYLASGDSQSSFSDTRFVMEDTSADGMTIRVSSVTATSQERLSPAGLTIVKGTAATQAVDYQSPYSQPAMLSPLSLSDDRCHATANQSLPLSPVTTGSEQVDSAADVNVSISEPQQIKKKHQEHEDRSVIIGGGNVARSRTSAVKEVLKRCNGAFPHNSEIVDIIPGKLWQEIAPKMYCPNRQAINKTLKNMVSDPNQNLVKYNFDFMTEGGATVKKAILAYKNLAFNSPEVQRVYQGIIQAYPKKYYPPEISVYVPVPQTKQLPYYEVDESFKLPEPQGGAYKQLQKRIKYSNEKREMIASEKPRYKAKDVPGEKLPKRARLLGLGAVNRSKNGQVNFNHLVEVRLPKEHPSEGTPLAHPILGKSQATRPSKNVDAVDEMTPESESESEAESESESEAESEAELSSTNDSNESISTPTLRTRESIANLYEAFIKPAVYFYPTTGTFSTEFKITHGKTDIALATTVGAMHSALFRPASFFSSSSGTFSTEYRPVIDLPPTENKDPKLVKPISTRPLQRPYVRRPYKRRKRKTGLDENESGPTLVQRLTGLTGNADEPDYHPPSKKRKNRKNLPTWRERKDKRRSHAAKKSTEPLDPVLKLKKLMCTLVVATSMSGEDDSVDWEIVKKVNGDLQSDLKDTEKAWMWMKTNMAAQVRTLMESFQSKFLEAYEEGNIASIEDPATYDWENLVRWATLRCEYSDPPLPVTQEFLAEYHLDISEYQSFSRVSWYKKSLASIVRSKLLNDYAFAAPLHPIKEENSTIEGEKLKARSWVRATISTPHHLYNKCTAHEKLDVLDTSVIEETVKRLVDTKLIRVWKIKRIRPGRNYDFTAKFALHYRRPFQLSDFMAAAELKKNLDRTFAMNERFSISRTADDGAVMALLSLVSDGRVKLVPKLPPVNNSLGAEQPRISVWGFDEGHYGHRNMNRARLFWAIEAVPTETYAYGNPLQPVDISSLSELDGSIADWKVLPSPPLPGLDNNNAPLPIWSTIDGQHVIYSWWNRILNLVIQVLMLQPGSTACQLFSHCPEMSAEFFEVKLVLGWLQQVNAVEKTLSRTYRTLPGFWAVFGDKLIDEENDWYGEHVKRKSKSKMLQDPTWRKVLNKGFATWKQAGGTTEMDASSSDEEHPGNENGTSVMRQIAGNSRTQYSVTKKALGITCGQASDSGSAKAAPQPQKRKRARGDDGGTTPNPPKKRRGRPPTNPKYIQPAPAAEVVTNDPAPDSGVEEVASESLKRKRAEDEDGDTAPSSPKKQRGVSEQTVEPPINTNLNGEGEDSDAEGEADDEYNEFIRARSGSQHWVTD
jgi:hypothetical protein